MNNTLGALARAALEQAAQDIVEEIKVRREHHIACGTDLRYTAGMYEAIRIAQEYAKAANPNE